jgi:diguanylate cyclase (GGDEF)-like protein/PAS domain S-box-containing protein
VLEAVFRLELLEKRQAVLSVSEGLESVLGFKAEDLLSARVAFADLLHPNDSDVARRLFSPTSRVHSGIANIRMRHADGRIRCMRGHFNREVSHGANPILDLTVQDVTTLHGEDEDGYSEVNLNAYMESVDDCVYFKNRSHVITAANRNCRRMFSKAPNELRDLAGMTDYDLFPENIADEFYELEKRVLTGMPMAHVVQHMVDKEEKREWMDVRKFPVKQGQDEILGVLTVISFITDAVRAEQVLNEPGALPPGMQPGAGAGVGSYVLDLKSGNWTSTDVLDRVLGIDKSFERTRESFRSLLHPDDRRLLTSEFDDKDLTLHFTREYRIIRPSDGAVRWIQEMGRLEPDGEGRSSVARVTVRDITVQKLAESATLKRRELLQRLITFAPAALAMFDREMRYLAVSRRWLEENSLVGSDIIGRSHYEVIPDIPEYWKQAHKRGLAGEKLRKEEDRFERADGRMEWVRWEMVPWRMDDNSVGGIVLFAEDITALKVGEEKLRLAASVFTHAFEGILITDANGTILDVNDAFTRITGYSREEALGRNPRLLKSGRQNKEFYADMWRHLIEEGHWSGEIWNRAKNGQIFLEMLTISAVPDRSSKTQQYVALFSDISYLKEQERQLERVAHYDLLTGLPNRVLLVDRIRQAMAQTHRSNRLTAIACLDLDGFKAINDQHGHNVGDQLLTEVTNRMSRALRDGETLARLGGDEFVAVLLDLATTEDSYPVIQKILDAAAEPVRIGDLVLQVSASLGVTFYPQADDVVAADQLLRQADQAMYHAKVAGKNRFHVFDPTHDRNVRGHHEDLERVRAALHSGEMVLYFQPRVNMCTGAIVSAEALVRWRHPEQGLLAPGQFMPIIEGNPLAIELGEWVIANALKQIELWRDEGLDLPVSVNIDAQQLQHPDFVNRLAILLEERPNVPPSRLELEVLESGALRDVTAVSQVIRTCNKLGVTFALDDFGTGYSSLSYLKRLPVHSLKIDQTFVHDMLNDLEDLTILEGVLGLANAFRREAVAEGVETVDHGLMLLRLGCQLAQGYGIARPMPGDQLPDWAANWRPDPRWANVSPIDPAHFALLYAGVEHRGWVAAIGEYLHGRRHLAPVLDSHGCRFGEWLDQEVSEGRGNRSGFQAIDALHQRLHSFANELLALNADGKEAEARAGLGELRSLRDSLLERLQYFVQTL